MEREKKTFSMVLEDDLYEMVRIAAFEKRQSKGEWLRDAAREKIERDSVKK